jgi:hypothetical protein
MELELLVGPVPVAVFVAVIVQALAWGGLLKTGQAKRIAVLVASLVGGVTWAAMTLAPEIEPYVSVAFTAIVGAALATLGYEGVGKLTDRS